MRASEGQAGTCEEVPPSRSSDPANSSQSQPNAAAQAELLSVRAICQLTGVQTHPRVPDTRIRVLDKGLPLMHIEHKENVMATAYVDAISRLDRSCHGVHAHGDSLPCIEGNPATRA
jgi:hypothetical protein